MSELCRREAIEKRAIKIENKNQEVQKIEMEFLEMAEEL